MYVRREEGGRKGMGRDKEGGEKQREIKRKEAKALLRTTNLHKLCPLPSPDFSPPVSNPTTQFKRKHPLIM